MLELTVYACKAFQFKSICTCSGLRRNDCLCVSLLAIVNVLQLEEDQQPPRDDEPQMLTFEVYWLDTMTHLKSHGTSKIPVSDVTTLEATVVTFGTQMHLLIHDRANPSLLYSTVLESSSASEVCEMQVQGSNVISDQCRTPPNL